MSIFKRILLACLAILAVGAAQTVFLWVKASRLGAEVDVVTSVPVAQLDAAHRAWEAFRNAEALVEDIGEKTSFVDAAASERVLAERLRLVDEALASVAAASPEKAQAKLQSARASIDAWRQGAAVLVGQRPALSVPAPHRMAQLTARIKADLAALQEDARAGVAAARADIMEDVASLKSASLILLGAGLALGLAMAALLARAITRPLGGLQSQMKQIAEGQLSVEIGHLKRRDEIGAMAQALLTFRDTAAEAERLRLRQNETEAEHAARKAGEMQALAGSFEAKVGSIVGAVTKAARALRATTEDLATAARDTNGQAVFVASESRSAAESVRSVATATEELSASVLSIASQTEAARQMTVEAADSARRSAAIVATLHESVSEIGAVVGVINTIASQTNLLALNATIEAARAGETGRGFAVVAGEVKALAGQTAKATQDISSRIQAVQAATREAVAAIEGIGRAIPQISDASESIALAMRQQEEATREIATSVQQAAAGVENVNAAIGLVSSHAQASGRSSDVMRTSFDELIERSERLDKEVHAFLAHVRAA